MKQDYTLAYLRYVAGTRTSCPAKAAYGVSSERARHIRSTVDHLVAVIRSQET